VIGCDIVVTTNAENLSKLSNGRSHAVVNSHVAPTSEFATNPDLDLSSKRMEDAIAGAARAGEFVSATRLATALCGDAIYTNPFLMGFAYQKGLLAGRPRRARARVRAECARRCRRICARSPGAGSRRTIRRVEAAARPRCASRSSRGRRRRLDANRRARVEFLTAYQNARFAERYRARVERWPRARRRWRRARRGSRDAWPATLRSCCAVKDEYEVARSTRRLVPAQLAASSRATTGSTCTSRRRSRSP
jgi:indolepyruvate ferredoxin oxidoreductase